MSNILLRNIKQLITCKGDGQPKSGKSQSDIGIITEGCVLIKDEKIEFVGEEKSINNFLKENKIQIDNEVDCTNKIVLPGLIDSHTHFIFAGSRANEYEMRIKGNTYEEIAEAGGGIRSTVEAVRKATLEDLMKNGEKRLHNFFVNGTLTIEGKSGYGLNFENEMKLLKVISDLSVQNDFNINIEPTFLGAHSFPEEISREEYINIICNEMIPHLSDFEGKVKFIDVFCEKNYYSSEETDKILTAGEKYNLKPRLHIDQFNSIGGVDVAIKHNAASIDHLEAMTDVEISKLRDSKKNIIATVLPGVSYFLDIAYAPARKLIENNIPVAIATDFNPGSCMTQNMRIIMSLASIKMELSAEEIINAITYNAAYSLRLSDKLGSIECGKQADILVYDYDCYKDLVYNFGMNDLKYIIKKGKISLGN